MFGVIPIIGGLLALGAGKQPAKTYPTQEEGETAWAGVGVLLSELFLIFGLMGTKSPFGFPLSLGLTVLVVVGIVGSIPVFWFVYLKFQKLVWIPLVVLVVLPFVLR